MIFHNILGMLQGHTAIHQQADEIIDEGFAGGDAVQHHHILAFAPQQPAAFHTAADPKHLRPSLALYILKPTHLSVNDGTLYMVGFYAHAIDTLPNF